jgi:hypothetical protein
MALAVADADACITHAQWQPDTVTIRRHESSDLTVLYVPNQSNPRSGRPATSIVGAQSPVIRTHDEQAHHGVGHLQLLRNLSVAQAEQCLVFKNLS